MRVLLVATDLYKTVGGGETVYRRLISSNPGIDFVYLRDREPPGAIRPANAKSIRLKAPRSLRVSHPSFSPVRLGNLKHADAIARSVQGETFDIVELPDYTTFGAFLRPCFAAHRVKFGAIVLAMHGNISTSFDLDWEPRGEAAHEERELEIEQFGDADARYAISKRYMAEWQARVNAPIHYIDPIAIVGRPDPVPWTPRAAAPDLYCIGRMERRKGNDLFIELVRWIDPTLYGKACHVGSHAYSRHGGYSERILTSVAEAREVRPLFLPSQDMAGLSAIYSSNAVLVLPVRYDSFNLVALEALLRGCPVIVSDAAGVCDYLDAELAGLPYLKLEMSNFYGALPRIERLLREYVEHRGRLLESLKGLALPSIAPDLEPIYKDALARAKVGEGHTSVEYAQAALSVRDRAFRVARNILPGKFYNLIKRLIRTPKAALGDVLIRLGLIRDARLAAHLLSSTAVGPTLRQIAQFPEKDPASIEDKVRLIQRNSKSPVYRCNVWLELARLERLRGNDLVAAAYDIRLMRLLGSDRFGRLREVGLALERANLRAEARACEVLYGSDASPEHVYDYLQAAYQHNLRIVPKDWAMVDDRRHGAPRVSVIVSLYNAASKLRLFLAALSQQTLVRKQQVEIILVDSGSNSNEYEVTRNFLSEQMLSVVYARSAQRETIQSAWNRGILLSRAPYLVFLGVDETLYPEALEQLADELDRNPSVDWVMANSLVTAVNSHGVFEKDVMPYDRTGATKDYTYLETCYLSWVGGMYRKSIHGRYGYYDESFRAAGDTEFKNRVLPHISVKFVPRTLGLFLNYPDERTTASPLAELEDTRAWYLHRTPGGVRYAFGERDPMDALALLYSALGYRKSYCTHISTDVEYGGYLLEHARLRGVGGELAPVMDNLTRMLASLRKLEWRDHDFGRLTPSIQLFRTWREARRFARAHAELLAGKANPNYAVLNDNRYEQHSWFWGATS